VDTVAEIAELERQAEVLARQRSSAGGDLIHRGYHQRAVEDAEESGLRWRAAEMVAAVLDTGMTQRDLAAKLGKSQTHVSFMLRAWNDYLGNDDRPLFAVAYAEAKQAAVAADDRYRTNPQTPEQAEERMRHFHPVLAEELAEEGLPTRRRLAVNKAIRAAGFEGGWDLRGVPDEGFSLRLFVMGTTSPDAVERFLASDVCAQLLKLAQAARDEGGD
jgi:hypothetical protein